MAGQPGRSTASTARWHARRGATDLGGFLDLLADFSIYGGFVVAVGVAVPEARLACLVLLLTYYVSGTAFLRWRRCWRSAAPGVTDARCCSWAVWPRAPRR